MVPRTVQMAKAVFDAGVDVELLGNIVFRQFRGWTNLGDTGYYTRNDPEYGDVQGFPTGFLYDVRSYDGSFVMASPTSKPYTPNYESRWGQPPLRPTDSISTIRPKGGISCSWIYPTADKPVAPPIDLLA